MQTRTSSALTQFCSSLEDQSGEDRAGLNILDLAAANQQTVTFLTEHYHRLYSQDLICQLDEHFGGRDFYTNQTDPAKVAEFLKTSLTFPEGHFDGALVWDSLQFLASPLLETVVERFWRMLRPGSLLLAVFQSEEHAQTLPLCSYRIVDQRTLGILPKGTRVPARTFNNRSLEKLFQDFESVKFFLTRDRLREVIVRR